MEREFNRLTAIVTPLRLEANMLLQRIADPEIRQGPGRKYTLGRLENAEVGIFCCGVGRLETRRWLEYIYRVYRPGFILMAGTAGALDDCLQVGDIVLATDFYAEQESGCVEGALAAELMAAVAELGLRSGGILTVDQVVQSRKRREKLRSRFGAVCVEMEGYEAAGFCREKGIPFAALRLISDAADESVLLDFRENLQRMEYRLIEAISALLARGLLQPKWIANQLE